MRRGASSAHRSCGADNFRSVESLWPRERGKLAHVPQVFHAPSLRFFEAAARWGFKQAASELHVTQGAVSQQIKHLEASLGCKLFYRLPRQMDLTEEGQRFAAAVAQGLALIDQEARALRASQSTVEVRVRAGPSFASRWLVPRLGRRFYKKKKKKSRASNIKLFILADYGYSDPARRGVRSGNRNDERFAADAAHRAADG